MRRCPGHGWPQAGVGPAGSRACPPKCIGEDRMNGPARVARGYTAFGPFLEELRRRVQRPRGGARYMGCAAGRVTADIHRNMVPLCSTAACRSFARRRLVSRVVPQEHTISRRHRRTKRIACEFRPAWTPGQAVLNGVPIITGRDRVQVHSWRRLSVTVDSAHAGFPPTAGLHQICVHFRPGRRSASAVPRDAVVQCEGTHKSRRPGK